MGWFKVLYIHMKGKNGVFLKNWNHNATVGFVIWDIKHKGWWLAFLLGHSWPTAPTGFFRLLLCSPGQQNCVSSHKWIWLVAKLKPNAQSRAYTLCTTNTCVNNGILYILIITKDIKHFLKTLTWSINH